MKLGLAGPVALPMLAAHVEGGGELPEGYRCAAMASWVEALLARGHEVSLFTLAPEVSEPRMFRGPRLTIHIGRYRARHRARDFFALERQDLLRAMRSDPCDLIHAHWTYEFALAALDSGLPVLVTAHDAPLNVLRLSPIPYRAIRVLMAYEVARRARWMTAVAEETARHFRRFLGYGGELEVIANGVAEDVFLLRAFPRSPTRAATFATVLNGFGRRKNGKGALRAFARVVRTEPGCRLLMFGEDYGGGESAELWARPRQLTAGVEFAGRLPHGELMRRLAQEVDVLVHPAREESLCMAVAEATALGLAVIAGERTAGMSYLLDHGRAGLLIDVTNETAMAEAMLALARDPRQRVCLGEAAHQYALHSVSAATMAAQYENAYGRVLTAWK